MINQDFLQKAAALTPALHHTSISPIALVRFRKDDAAWQQLRVVRVGKPDSLQSKTFQRGNSFCLEFPESSVGRLSLTLNTKNGYNDAPVRLRLIFAETPLEVIDRDKPFPKGSLCPAWIQEEIVTFDDLPGTYKLPRRYSMRYLFIEVLGAPADLVFQKISFRAESSAQKRLPSPSGLDDLQYAMDRAACRTLRNCMQTVLEDGPKRDRRLWLGDLRLQAKVNARTYRNFDIVEHCLYLLAAFPADNGMIKACVFERPEPRDGFCIISDYAMLLSDLLLDHWNATRHKEFLEDMYPVAVRQFELFRDVIHAGKTPSVWNFIDWCEKLDRTVPEAGVYLFSLDKLAKLARALGRTSDADTFECECRVLRKQFRQQYFDEKTGFFLSGPDRQISWASQIWMILAGVLDLREAASLLAGMDQMPSAIRPVTPYLWHHYLDACEAANDTERIDRTLRSYWGGMIKAGYDTFPEVFVPSDPMLSPYGGATRINSACHAWSCAPAYFLRKKC